MRVSPGLLLFLLVSLPDLYVGMTLGMSVLEDGPSANQGPPVRQEVEPERCSEPHAEPTASSPTPHPAAAVD